MFDTAELGRKVPSSLFKEQEPKLRAALLDAQQELLEQDRVAVAVLFAGVAGAGTGETVNLLNAWMDPRYLVTRAFGPPTDEERERGPNWRYLKELPPRGHVGLLQHAWYSQVLEPEGDVADGHALEDTLERLCILERMLADDGIFVVKFWMHLSRKAQKKRLKQLEQDPARSFSVTKEKWRQWKDHEERLARAEKVLRVTSTGATPWFLVECTDERYRDLEVGQVLLRELRRRLSPAEAAGPVPAVVAGAPVADGGAPAAGGAGGALEVLPADRLTVLSTLDMERALSKEEYDERLPLLQGRLGRLHRKLKKRGQALMLAFEGWDAAGKGGSIRRVTAALDARDYDVIPIAAPTDEERARHYLWRFIRHSPRPGRVVIFDRSWYGRVLVERVEGFASEDAWRRAYGEIRYVEQAFRNFGVLLGKFWVHITPEEQERRFHERAATEYKRHKLTAEDWRNRQRWADYELAVHEMVGRTSTRENPWTLVEGNDKRYARIKVLSTICTLLEEGLGEKDEG